MGLFRRTNQYQGINAHLHSYLQHEDDGWQSFHGGHTTHIRDMLEQQLPSGYYARSEKGLQIREINPETGELIGRRVRTIPDVNIYQRLGAVQGTAIPEAVADPTMVVDLADSIPPEEHMQSVVIYKRNAPGKDQAVTRIELLSPANKPGKSHYSLYMQKRLATLQAGICLIELDYLHETRPVLSEIPSYPDQEPEAYPYSIIISDPRPVLEQGKTYVYGFHVDDPIPLVYVPLAGVDKIKFSFDAVYQYTFQGSRFYTEVAVDYSIDPVAFERYVKIDQERIRARMESVKTTDEQTSHKPTQE